MADRSEKKPDARPKRPEAQVDIEALTAAVERLLRRDLQIAHERLHPRGGKRR